MHTISPPVKSGPTVNRAVSRVAPSSSAGVQSSTVRSTGSTAKSCTITFATAPTGTLAPDTAPPSSTPPTTVTPSPHTCGSDRPAGSDKATGDPYGAPSTKNRTSAGDSETDTAITCDIASVSSDPNCVTTTGLAAPPRSSPENRSDSDVGPTSSARHTSSSDAAPEGELDSTVPPTASVTHAETDSAPLTPPIGGAAGPETSTALSLSPVSPTTGPATT